MTREEASNILNDFDVNFEGHTAEEIAEAFDMAFKALEQEPCTPCIEFKRYAKEMGFEIEQEPKAGHWTPISEGLPEENKTVIASSEYGVYPEARYTKENGWEWAYETLTDYYWAELANVTAWMPLPKPYKEESEEE